jgi:hypothetical protein
MANGSHQDWRRNNTHYKRLSKAPTDISQQPPGITKQDVRGLHQMLLTQRIAIGVFLEKQRRRRVLLWLTRVDPTICQQV